VIQLLYKLFNQPKFQRKLFDQRLESDSEHGRTLSGGQLGFAILDLILTLPLDTDDYAVGD
jgi:hypothetical protein